jgi:predicted nucleic-acid-binding Zn-ribbon protein
MENDDYPKCAKCGSHNIKTGKRLIPSGWTAVSILNLIFGFPFGGGFMWLKDLRNVDICKNCGSTQILYNLKDEESWIRQKKREEKINNLFIFIGTIIAIPIIGLLLLLRAIDWSLRTKYFWILLAIAFIIFILYAYFFQS